MAKTPDKKASVAPSPSPAAAPLVPPEIVLEQEKIGVPGGILTGKAIKEREIISRGVQDSYRDASYDLCIGELISPDGTIVYEYLLPPRGIVEVISRERVQVPDDLVGIAMVKTSLCNDGILALGIGVIDPGWDGPISSYLINFGKNSRHLTRGDVFLRTTFQRLEGPLPKVKGVVKTDRDVREARRKATVGFIGDSFLNLSEELDKLTREQEQKRWLRVIVYVGALATMLAVLGFFLTWFTSGMAGKPQTSSLVVSQPLASEIDTLRNENTALQSRLARIEAQLGAGARRPSRPGVIEPENVLGQ